jgi:hyaluronoglucosaminidase
VVNNGSGTVTPISTATNTPLKPVKVGSDPLDIAITPDGKTTYVTSPEAVTPIRTATNTALGAIKVRYYSGNWHMPVVITPDGKTAYAVGGMLTPIRTATNTALKTIQLGGWAIIVVVIR